MTQRSTRTFDRLVIGGLALAVALGLSAGAPGAALAEEGAGEINVESPEALGHLFRQLRAAEKGQPGPPVRISFYTDSINGWDGVTSYLRARLQKRFGDGGRGWVHVAPGWNYQHQRDVIWEHSSDWRTHVVNRGHGPDGRYGFGGVMAADGSRRSSVTYATTRSEPTGSAVSRFQLFYQAYPGAGAVRIAVDGGEPRVVRTEAAAIEDRVHLIEVPDGSHTFEVSVAERDIRLYGVVMERDGPGVVVDSVALIGARVARLLRFNQAHWQRQIELRQPDLLVFWLGANNATSRRWTRTAFVRDYGRAIASARRGRPEASCLVISVTDVGERETGVTRARIPDLVQAQREVAQAQGCAFFDLFHAMGGAGTIRRWVHGSPRLGTPDYRHLTPAGARRIGELLHDALIRSYERAQR